MSTPYSTRSPSLASLRNRPGAALAGILAACALTWPAGPAGAQQIVFDPKSYAESLLQTARQLESLQNQASMLANQAHALARSPYSHLAQTSQTLSDIGQLARQARGLAVEAAAVERQFQDVYPAAAPGTDPQRLRAQAQARAATARETAQDLARTAAELDRLSEGRATRVAGALAAAQSAEGTTAAVQSATQLLAALSEGIGALQAASVAQSRLMAEEAARGAADRAAGEEVHRRLWSHPVEAPAPPAGFAPFAAARN